MWLKVYEWEYTTWPEFQKVILEPCKADLIIRKLVRHFKVPPVIISFGTFRSGGGRYRPGWFPLKLSEVVVTKRNILLGTVIHEFAHHLTKCRWGSGHHHDRKFKRELKRTYTWAKRYLP